MATKELISCRLRDLGLISFEQAYQVQLQAVARAQEEDEHSIIVCEHPAVLTLGRMSHIENVLASKDELKKRDIKTIPIDRGGDITLHAPGQLVVYPILNLSHFGRDLHVFMRSLEQAIIDLLKEFGILARRDSGHTGVYVGTKKIASIGIGVKKWISFHGLSLNINTDLDLYKLIKPCGLDVQMSSMADQLNCPINITEVKEKMVNHLSSLFALELDNGQAA